MLLLTQSGQLSAVFREGPMATLGGPEDLREGPGPSQQITKFRKSVSHNFSMHLIVGLVNYL